MKRFESSNEKHDKVLADGYNYNDIFLRQCKWLLANVALALLSTFDECETFI